MAIRKKLSLAATVGVFILSLITFASLPVEVTAWDNCAVPEGNDAGVECLGYYPYGGFWCWQCVGSICGGIAQGDGECYSTCYDRGVEICGGG